MKHLLVLLLVVLLGDEFCFAQTNLVFNPSFEDTIGSMPPCDIREAIGWNLLTGAPDYYNPQNISDCKVPKNLFGYQIPFEGKSYCGMITYPSVIKESIRRQLANKLQIGLRYYLNLWVSLGDSANFAANNIGVGFSCDSLPTPKSIF